jgi:hypothetical protein
MNSRDEGRLDDQQLPQMAQGCRRGHCGKSDAIRGTAAVSPTHSGRQPMTRRRPTSIALRLAFDHTPFV